MIIESLQSAESSDFLGILDSNNSLWGEIVLGVPVLGGDELLSQLAQQGATHFVVGLGGIGDNRPRQRLFELGTTHGLTPITVRHSKAICSPSATVGAGSVLFPGSVVNAQADLGVNVIVNTGAIVEHDSAVGDHVHLATGSRLCSTVKVGPGAHIGAGATVRQSINIGAGAVVGAGAAVVEDVAAGVTVVGVPARPTWSGNV